VSLNFLKFKKKKKKIFFKPLKKKKKKTHSKITILKRIDTTEYIEI